MKQRFVVEELDPRTLTANPANFRRHPDSQRRALRASLSEHGAVAAPIFNRRTGHLIDGHARVEMALEDGEERILVNVVEMPLAQEKRLLRSFDAITSMALIDDGALEALIAEIDDAALEQILGEVAEAAAGPDGEASEVRETLAERFGVPPFSVLDARQGYWQDRKRAWIALGIQSELGRGDVMPSGAAAVVDGSSEWSGYRGPVRGNVSPGGSPRDAASLGADGHTVRGDGKERALSPGQSNGQDLMRGEHVVGERRMTWVAGEKPIPELDETSRKILAAQPQSGTSIFDPVLCELAYRWFSPERGRVLDPFAGGSVRGIVAQCLGRQYVGVDLSEAQIQANRVQAEAIGVCPDWIVGDSRECVPLVGGDEFDFIFSCPPYADLEVYSDDPRDLSTLAYPEFLAGYREIIQASVALLKENRFACFVVGDVRDPKGFYRNFVADTIAAFQDAGMGLYNEAMLVTAVGSLPIRVGKQFGSYRKLGKTHQNVLVFYRGDPARIKEIAAECEFGEIDADLSSEG